MVAREGELIQRRRAEDLLEILDALFERLLAPQALLLLALLPRPHRSYILLHPTQPCHRRLLLMLAANLLPSPARSLPPHLSPNVRRLPLSLSSL